LRTLRVDGERQAERILAAAVAALREAQAVDGRLVADAGRATDALAVARAPTGRSAPARAADAQMTRRYWARLAEVVSAAEGALAAHRAGPLAAAERIEAAARAAHTRARQQRDAIDKVLARREARARREAGRRAEAAHDDRITRR
jgi:hypothetical protein